MFSPKTEKIKGIAKDRQEVICKLDSVFNAKTRIYIDYANVRPWSNKLGWHIDTKRLKQFLDSFNTIEAINFYNGYIEGNQQSEKEIKEIENQKYIVRTKPVKIMRFSIDASSVSLDSTALLNHFIKRSLLRKYEVSTIEYLNERFKDMNRKGEYYIEDRKCNFDVEIGVDMLLDLHLGKIGTFVLWSGDSDFTDPLQRILREGKRAILFATAGRISRELSDLRRSGLEIFDIGDLKEFICWLRENRA
ncbi:MAG: NYN domain-containing protein [Candidatus Gottesmanbacteria bacterium]|nr:NYN domain-containing protein [Candidatus Gottesmanbacteria bacterium]